MKTPIDSAVQVISEKGPEFSIHTFSFFKIGFFIAFSFLIYYLSGKLVRLMLNTGVLGRTSLYYKILKACTFIVPVFFFLIGLVNVSQDSLIISFFFFITFSIVLGYSLIDPAQSLIASVVIGLRENLMVGDYIVMKDFEGEVLSIDTFHITLQSPQGVKTYIPTHHILKTTYEVHSKKEGPSVTMTIPSDKISRRNLERLAHLCPFRKQDSTPKISNFENGYKLSMEIINQNCRLQVNEYFEKHWQ